MAYKYICDGCKMAQDKVEGMTPVGHVIKKIYCPKCHGTCKEYLAEVDILHEKTALKFKKELAKVRKSYSDRDFDLPDTVETEG